MHVSFHIDSNEGLFVDRLGRWIQQRPHEAVGYHIH